MKQRSPVSVALGLYKTRDPDIQLGTDLLLMPRSNDHMFSGVFQRMGMRLVS